MKKILLIFGLFLVFGMNVFASEHLDLVPIEGVYSSQLNVITGEYFSSNQKKYIINDEMVYCIEPGMGIMTRDYNMDLNLFNSGIDSEVLEKMRLIGYYGYDYPEHKTDNYFLATQELLWELMNNDVHFTTELNGNGNIIDIEKEKSKILGLINNHYKKPSFNDLSYEGIYQESIILTDSNNVLNQYEVVSSNNDVRIDGNRLIVKFTSFGKDKVVLRKKKYDDKVSIYYNAYNSQDFMFLRVDEVLSVVNLESYLPSSVIEISKTGGMLTDIDGLPDNYDFVYNERGLSNVLFGIYAGEDIYEVDSLIYRKDELVESISTVNGKAVSSKLPNGKYYIKELKSADGFILDDSVIDVVLNNTSRDIYTYKLNLSNERQKIFINLHKQGEVFDSVIDSQASYSNADLEGIKFGLYTGHDIYDVDGDLLVLKDTLIKTLVTDENGIFNGEVDIPFGTYYLKELETKSGYKIDSNIYEFNVSYNNDKDNIEIFITKEPIVNEVIKSNLVIYKVDSSDNSLLADAYFKIFDDSDNLIYEGKTDQTGILSIDNLGYGKYHFYEVVAPNGYIISNKVYDFVVDQDNEIIEIKVNNNKLPVTSNINLMSKSLSLIGISFGFISLSIATIYDKKNKNN